jgi:hypothetical protein
MNNNIKTPTQVSSAIKDAGKPSGICRTSATSLYEREDSGTTLRHDHHRSRTLRVYRPGAPKNNASLPASGNGATGIPEGRGQYVFNDSLGNADRLGVPLNWEYHVVPGVGHDEAGMAGPSAALLFAPGA